MTIPPPALLGIQSPTIAKDRAGRTAWQSRPRPATPPAVAPDAQMAELNVAPAADSDRFASMADTPAPSASDSDLDPGTGSGPGLVGSVVEGEQVASHHDPGGGRSGRGVIVRRRASGPARPGSPLFVRLEDRLPAVGEPGREQGFDTTSHSSGWDRRPPRAGRRPAGSPPRPARDPGVRRPPGRGETSPGTSGRPARRRRRPRRPRPARPCPGRGPVPSAARRGPPGRRRGGGSPRRRGSGCRTGRWRAPGGRPGSPRPPGRCRRGACWCRTSRSGSRPPRRRRSSRARNRGR